MKVEDNVSPAPGIAIVGMACRFQDASSVDQYWANLCDGVESITSFTEKELDPSVPDAVRTNPNYVRARGILDGIEDFDARFFGLSPLEADIMDPQQRLMLELAWEALEDAGHRPARYDGLIGVFAGMTSSDYGNVNLRSRPDVVRSAGDLQVMLANGKDYLAPLISYRLDLKGPSLNVNTACSTSLVAACAAYDSLHSYQCDMALAGGVTIRVPQRTGYLWQEVMIFSKDGHCRPFDALASGTVASNGGGMVVLKRLEDAVADNDRIYGVIRGTGVNNDGSGKMSFMAPSVDGQARAIAMALADAGLDPADISFIETHGTGTTIGDPIEIEALHRVYGAGAAHPRTCALGSAKSNLGHLDSGAGVAGLIKATLSVYHGKIPATLHFREINPAIDLEKGPFFINDALTEWPVSGAPRRAAVSSFGVGGTNAHVVLEQAPERARTREDRSRVYPIVLSGQTPEALEAATANLGRYLAENPTVPLRDVAFTLGAGRTPFAHRRLLTGSSVEEVIEQCAVSSPRSPGETRAVREPTAGVAFMFPGQGAQHVGMGRALYERGGVFRDIVDRCSKVLEPLIEVDLREVLYPGAPVSEEAKLRLRQTRLNQPAMFVIEYALAKLWESWGVTPTAMIGHSLGEYVAACLAGVFSLDDALHLVAHRGRLMQAVPPGSMLIVRLSAEQTSARLPAGLSLAAVNSPELCVVSGPTPLVSEWERELEAESGLSRMLETSHAFHSAMMDPVLPAFHDVVAGFELAAPRIPFVSTATGTWITPEQATDPDYWTGHIRNTVRFSEGLLTLWEDPALVLLEVGPGSTATRLAKAHAKNRSSQFAISSLGSSPQAADEATALSAAFGALWLGGADVSWDSFCAEDGARRISLPTYPFQRTRHWVEPGDLPAQASSRSPAPERSGAESRPEPIRPVGVTDKTVGEDRSSGWRHALTDTERTLADIWERVLADASELDADRDFFDLGGHSLMAMPLFAEIEAQTGIDLPLSTLFEAPTIRRMARVLDRARAGGDHSAQARGASREDLPEPGPSRVGKEKWRSIVRLQAGEDLVPFFCVHAIGGNVVNYAQFLPYLDRRQPFYGLQAVGLDGISPPPPTIEAMAANYLREMRAVQPEGPYLLGGGSMGGLVALEIAQQIHAAGGTVELLVMFDTEGPNTPPAPRSISMPETGSPLRFGIEAVRQVPAVAKAVRRRVAQLFRRKKCEMYRRAKSPIPHGDRYWYLELLHREVLARYAPEHYDGTISMVRAVPPEEDPTFEPEHGWKGMAGGGIEVTPVHGEHSSFIEEPGVAQALSQILQRAQVRVRASTR